MADHEDRSGARTTRSPWVVYLDETDDLASIRDRLNWSGSRRILLVLPEGGRVLGDYLDLVLLRRHADDLRIDVALVTDDGQLRRQASGLGFPLFSSAEESLESDRGWWRGRRRSDYAGQRRLLDEADRMELARRKKARPTWQKWSLRYAAIVLYFLTLAVLLIAAVYALPGARLTLEPDVVALRVERQIVADPQLEVVRYGGASVPGRVVSTIQEWGGEVATTGVVDVADASARGTIVFANRLNQSVTVPAGTRVSTTAGRRIVFQTLQPVEVPGQEGATAEAEVVAIEPGPAGNVDANLINRVEGPLGLQLAVRNVEALSGGGARSEAAVSEADQVRLREQVLQQLQALAAAELAASLGPQEFLARDSVRVARIIHETYSHFPGERGERLALEMRAELRATAVDETAATSLVYAELTGELPAGYELVAETLSFENGPVLGVDGEGRVTFEMGGSVLAAARLSVDEVLDDIAGQEIGLASAYLYERLPLRDYPRLQVWPAWFGRVPYLPVRIDAKIDAGV
ncbi:MAG: baseplate J/gp47 family protein [Candidatus Promineifilaceae bacterium]|nr:baseplate J/gp47 family protein [Candidatus Promineifilaceae bacterium]